MMIYNVTTKVAWLIHDEWLQWMQEVHIPEVIATGYFEKCQVMRLLEVEEDDGPTYAMQYYADSEAKYRRYLELHAPALRLKTIRKWGDQIIAFRTLMKVIN